MVILATTIVEENKPCLTFNGALLSWVREQCQKMMNLGTRSYRIHTCTRVPICNVVAPSFESRQPPIFVAWRSDIISSLVMETW